MSSAHLAAPFQRIADDSAAPADSRTGRGQLRFADRVEQEGEDRGHRLGRLAVEPVRIALPHPDDIGEAVVAQLDDDRGDALARVVVRPGDAERVPQREPQDLVTSGSDPRQPVHRLPDRGPQAIPAEPDRVVGRQAGLGLDPGDDPARLGVVRVERGVERHGHDLRGRDQPGDPARAGR